MSQGNPEPQVLDAQDAAAFRAFYAGALPRIYGYFLNRCGNDPAVAEDLTQETFMGAVRELKAKRSVDLPMPWLYGIARHKLVDHLRRKEREQRGIKALEGEAEVAAEVVEWDPATDREAALAALAAVPHPQRTALVLRYLDGLPVGEVAQRLGRSVHATESLLMRGKATFRRSFGEVSDA